MRLLHSPLWRRASLSACLSVAWLQLFAFAPLRWETNLVLIWWSAMAGIVTVQHIRTRSYSYLVAFLLPVIAAVVWSVEHPETISKVLGFAVASLPFWIAAWPTRDSLERAHWTFDAYLAGQLVLGAGLWAIVSLAYSEDQVSSEGWFVLLCLAAALPVSLRLVAQPSSLRCHTGLACLAALVVTSISISADVGLLEVRDGFGDERVWQIAALVGVAALALHYGVRFKALAGAPASPRWISRVHDYAGVILAGALLVVAMLLVSGWVPALNTDPENADSINQAGWSVCWAIAGLVLLLRGLLTRCVTWRRAGMLALFATGTKLVAVDLVHVSMLWRVLSFAGLGACLLLGAYAYRRIGIWAEAEGPPS